MIAFPLLGLSPSIESRNSSGVGIKKHLLRLKFSMASFLAFGVGSGAGAAVKNTLFPAICAERLVDFSNTYRGLARACAADDFDLSLSAENGQIEVFDSYQPPNSQLYNPIMNHYGDIKGNSDYYYNGPSFGLPLGQGHMVYEELSSHESSQPYFKDEEPVNYPAGHHHGYAQREQCLNDFVSRGMHSEHQSHFAINAYGINANPTFTDFRPQSFNDCLSYGSSLGSFDSPLDDLLFPGPQLQPEVPMIHAPQQRKRSVPELYVEQQETFVSAKRFKSEPVDFYAETKEVNVEIAEDKEDDKKGRFACSDCDASFKVKSYLTRHMKKHTNSKAFVCPFYKVNFNDADAANKCHPNGGFSRKDTYTTHMKALHFVYPPRTKSRQRSTLGGRCTGCFEYFDNNACWLKNHIEPYLCPGLHEGPHSERPLVKQEESE